MPFGCFGKRRKRDKTAENLAEKATKNADSAKTGADGNEVSDAVTVTRAHSLHASAPNSIEHRHTTIGIQKSATLARYDFLRKSDFANSADRWVALKQQYLLSPTAGSNNSSNGGQQHRNGGISNGSANAVGVRRTAQSLPRQFAPPSSASMLIGASGRPVRFSQWFYDRQTMESDARREIHEREEKNRKLLEGIADSTIPEETQQQPPAVAAAACNGDSPESIVAVSSDQGGTGDSSGSAPAPEPSSNSQEAKSKDQPTINNDNPPAATDSAEATDHPKDSIVGDGAQGMESGSKDHSSVAPNDSAETETDETTTKKAVAATAIQAESD